MFVSSVFSFSQAGSPDEAVFILRRLGPVQICGELRDRMPGKRPIIGEKASTARNMEQMTNTRETLTIC
jgi:hypothetical protein